MCRVDSRRGDRPLSAQVWQERPLWAQLRGPVSRASQREASAHQGDGCWLPVTLASLRRARAKGAAGRRGWSARESHQEESAQRDDTVERCPPPLT